MDKRNGGGRVATHDATTHTAIVLTLALVLGVIGFLAAGSVARSASEKTGSVSLRTTKLGLVLVNRSAHFSPLMVSGNPATTRTTRSARAAMRWLSSP